MIKVTPQTALAFGWAWCECKKDKTIVNAYMVDCVGSNLFDWLSEDESIVKLLQPLSDGTRHGSTIYINSLAVYREGVKQLKKAGYKITNEHPPAGWGKRDPDMIY